MEDGASLLPFMYDMVWALNNLTGFRLRGVYEGDTDQIITRVKDRSVCSAIEDSSSALRQISTAYAISKLIQSDLASNLDYIWMNASFGLLKRFGKIYSRKEMVEFGGGVGGGFQIFCDEKMVITLGGGCGGGMLGSNSGPPTMGGGCGGGFQILESFGLNSRNYSNRFYSIGGGGGCGTCTNNDLENRKVGGMDFTSSVVCGDAMDANALSNSAFQNILCSQYTPSNFQQLCERVTVVGGGGGGGGFTSSGGEVTGCGYSYSFYLSSFDDGDSNINDNKSMSIVDRVTSEEFTKLMISKQTKAPVDRPSVKTPYEIFSQLVQDSVSSCQGSGDWVCICKVMGENLSFCRMKSSKSISKIATSTRLHEKGSKSLHCDTINQFNATLSSILQNSCPNVKVIPEPGGKIDTTDFSSDLCVVNNTSSNTSQYVAHTMLRTTSDPPWTLRIYDHNNSASARILGIMASQLLGSTASVPAYFQSDAHSLGVAMLSRGYEQSNAFVLFEWFTACTVMFMVIVAWLKVFGGQPHRYIRIPDELVV